MPVVPRSRRSPARSVSRLTSAEKRRRDSYGRWTILDLELTRADFPLGGPLMASALAGSIPVALVYSFFVDQYAAGLTAGAVKG